MFKHIVVAYDGSQGGLNAVAMACDLAKQLGASLHMISVEEIPNIPASIDEVIETKTEENHKFHDALAKARAIAKQKGVKLNAEVVAGHAVSAIVAYVKAHKADLLVVGFMGHSALYERIIGGTADRLVRLAPCPVLVVK
jgi:nucleotide-binding universal stress UspA family protein